MRTGGVRGARDGNRFVPWFGVRPNTSAHRALLWLGLVVSLAFNVAILINGALEPGYDWLRQPMSALSLGPAGWIQVAGFTVYGLVQVLTAAAWRASLAGGFAVTAYPVVKIVSGSAMLFAGAFSQDPGNGYPTGIDAPLVPSMHAVIHQFSAFTSLTAAVLGLVLLAIRFYREPAWRGWAPWAVVTAVLMMGCLAAFGTLTSQHGNGGIFEKTASWLPALYGSAILIRLLAGDAQVRSAPPRAKPDRVASF